MFFLTYIQGNLVNEWVKGVNAGLRTQVTTQGWATTDEHLWNGVIGAFNSVMTLRGQTNARRVPVIICGTRGSRLVNHSGFNEAVRPS
jgi:hypothetical protein